MFEYSPPAKIGDLNDTLKAQWSAVVHDWFKNAIERLQSQQSPSDIRLFDLIDTPSGSSGTTAEIQWNGFPRKYKLTFADLDQRWQTVEQVKNADLTGRQAAYFKQLPDGSFVRDTSILFRDQDEYCEWHSHRSPTGELNKVVFTSENPEYWQFIADNDTALLVSLYEQLTGQSVPLSDLIFGEDIFVPGLQGEPINLNGKYNPHNKWNSTHDAVHLSHPANSLSAEVFLAADASILRVDDNGPVSAASDLICCARYGGPDRSSDPSIGAFVNGLVAQGLSVTINDPVGLYIHSLDPTPFELPNGVSFDDCWKVIRGNQNENQILRAEFALPDGGPLSDVLVGGEPLKFGAQIAEFISVVIYGKAFDAGNGLPTPKTCEGHCCINPDLPSLQTIRPAGDPCPPVPENALLAAATEIPPDEAPIPDLTNVKDAYTR